MLRNYLAVTIGHLSRSWLYTGITVMGLAVGFAAAMLIGLYVRDEHSFERFITGYQHVYRLEADKLPPGQKLQSSEFSMSTAAGNLAQDFPDVKYVARLALSSQWVGQGQGKTRERVAWVDPDFFRVLPYPVLAGDPIAAMHDPDGVVLTRTMARKYFGEDAPIGKTLIIQPTALLPAPLAAPHTMVVKAVLEDIPSETHLRQFEIFASGRAAWSKLTRGDDHPSRALFLYTYAMLRPGASPERIRAGLRAFASRHYPGPIGWRFRLEPLKDLHFTGDARAVDAGIAAIGALIILIAAINFVTLMTARATRRAVEVGVRKVLGARRVELIVQFMGEALAYVLAATLLSIVIVKLALPPINTFLRRTIAFDYLRDPWLAAAILGTALVTGLLAGFYPAVVLSSFRPASALKGGGGRSVGSAHVRQALVVVQFTILTGLIIVAATIYRQTSFAVQNILRLDEDQVLSIAAPCDSAFKQALATLPGVKDVTCASLQALGAFPLNTLVKDPVRGDISINAAPIDVGFFEMHGLKPLAGRFFSEDRGEDVVLDQPGASPESQPSLVLNESAVRQLGFKSPQGAVGKSISWHRLSATPPGTKPPLRGSQIVGVVSNFTLNTLREPIRPTMYYVDPKSTGSIDAKLEGRRLPETLRAIDELWRRSGHTRPIDREFLGQAMREAYRDVLIQGTVMAVSTGVAVLIACMGLFGLAAFTAQRRTKEIGVRKAMGASTSDVVRLLLWQFTGPVLLASLIAWPAAYWAAGHWLRGFAYRVSLPLWLFLSASAVTVLIALVTVGAHAWLAAHTKPADVLRYE